MTSGVLIFRIADHAQWIVNTGRRGEYISAVLPGQNPQGLVSGNPTFLARPEIKPVFNGTQMPWKSAVVRLTNSVRESGKSRIACLLACLHISWFVLAIANMSPPSPALGGFLDQGGGSSATLLAGRPFHFHYESLELKLLVLADLPSSLAMIPVSLPIAILLKALGFGFYSDSYVTAILVLVGATCQWLLVGRNFDIWLARRYPMLQAQLHRWSRIFVAVTIVITCALAPIINERSRAAGFRHGGISFYRGK